MDNKNPPEVFTSMERPSSSVSSLASGTAVRIESVTYVPYERATPSRGLPSENRKVSAANIIRIGKHSELEAESLVFQDLLKDIDLKRVLGVNFRVVYEFMCLKFHFETDDASGREKLPLHFCFRFPLPMFMDVQVQRQGPEVFYRWVYDRAREVILHELDENFRVKGKLFHDPHADDER